MNKKDFYAIFFKSGQFVSRNNIDEFSLLPLHTVECFLYARYDNTFKGPSNITDWYQFYFVDKDGQPTSYKVGNFEVTYIGTDNGCTNFFGRDVTIRDCRNERYYQYKSMCWYNRFIPDEIKPLLDRLNNCEDEDEIIQVIDDHVPYEMLSARYQDLKSTYDSLFKESVQMRKTIRDMSSVISDIRMALEKLDRE